MTVAEPLHPATGLERQVAILWLAQAEFRAGLAAGDADRIEVALDAIDMLVSRAEPRSALHLACGRALICLHDELLVAEHRRRQAARPRRSRKPAALTADLIGGRPRPAHLCDTLFPGACRKPPELGMYWPDPDDPGAA